MSLIVVKLLNLNANSRSSYKVFLSEIGDEIMKMEELHNIFLVVAVMVCLFD